MSFPEKYAEWRLGDPLPASPTYTGSAQPVAEPSKRVPVERFNVTDVLERIERTLKAMLTVQQHLEARASAGESRSSASVKASTRGHDLEVKSYGDGLLDDAITDAIRGYARGMRELAALQKSQWVETLDALQP